jgi:proteasome lid subunit RPN8/RPN11
MRSLSRHAASLLILVTSTCCIANEHGDCASGVVVEHVLGQIAAYGPRSRGHEYFGFIYRHEGRIASAVVRGSGCPVPASCGVNTREAAAQIPARAKVLGEWHTHPHGGSATLSREDVRGAHANRNIRCYAAFFAKPEGEICAWDPRRDSVAGAMSSCVAVGRYARRAQPRDGTAVGASIGSSIDRAGVENHTGSFSPMWKQSSRRMPNLPGR